MRIVAQRSKKAHVTVDGKITGAIDHGLVLLVGITHEDTPADVSFCAKKVANLRIFDDAEGKMNLSVQQTGGQILSISQFTLYGNAKKGNRPNFMAAARPEFAKELYDSFNESLRQDHGLAVETGIFGAMMDVALTNDGPVTIIVESP